MSQSTEDDHSDFSSAGQESQTSNKSITASTVVTSKVEGAWVRLPHAGKKPTMHFVPASLEEAKNALRQSAAQQALPRMNRVQVCHGCHGVVGEGAHQGSLTGKNRCTLRHSPFCKGNIEESESWRPCPTDYQFNSDVEIVSDTGLTDTLGVSSFQPSAFRGSTPAGSTQSLPEHPTVVHVGADQQKPINSQPKVSDFNTKKATDSAEIFGDLPPHLVAQIREFRASNQLNNKQSDKPEGSISINDLRNERALQEIVEKAVGLIPAEIPSLSAAPSAGANVIREEQLQQHTPAEKYEWVYSTDGNKQLVKISNSDGPRLNTSRNVTFQTQNRASLRNNSSRSNLSPNGQCSEPARIQNKQVMHSINEDPRVAEYNETVYGGYETEFRCSPTTGRTYKVQVPAQIKSHDTQLYRLEYRCSPTSGRTWQVKVPITPPPQSPPRTRYRIEWRIDPRSGVKYQVEVPVQNADQFESEEMQFIGANYHENSGLNNNGLVNNTVHTQAHASSHQNIVSGINRLEKNSRKKDVRVVEYAKNCPVKWAKTVNSTNINLPLYIWSSIAELEAAMSGRAEQLQEGELVGKLRHIKNIAEVCCLNSNITDFLSYGWSIARDYATKVEDEVNVSIVHWANMQPGIRTSSLVAAQMDCPRGLSKPTQKTKESE